MDHRITPADLGRELDVDAKRIRVFLRVQYGKLNRSVTPRWELTQEQAAAVREHFARRQV